MKNSLKEAKKPISIVNNLDLNEIQNIRQPYGVSGTKIMCCGPCKSEPIMTYFSINKSNFIYYLVIVSKFIRVKINCDELKSETRV